VDADARPEPQVPDTFALRRRVLLTAVVTLGLFLVYGYLLAAAEASQVWVLPGIVILYVVVVRPLMRPVREAVQLRRRLAYQAYLDSRQDLGTDRG
jgi:small-conductance mechanosensitive channel